MPIPQTLVDDITTIYQWSQANRDVPLPEVDTINVIIGDGENVVTCGIAAVVRVDFRSRITGAVLQEFDGISGSIEVTVEQSAGGAAPTWTTISSGLAIIGGRYFADEDLSAWSNTYIDRGDYLRFSTPCFAPPPLSGTVTGDVFTPRAIIGTQPIAHSWTAMNCRVSCPDTNTALVVWDAQVFDASMTLLFQFSGGTTAPGATTSVLFDYSVMSDAQRHAAASFRLQASNNSSTAITQNVTFEVLSYTGPSSQTATSATDITRVHLGLRIRRLEP